VQLRDASLLFITVVPATRCKVDIIPVQSTYMTFAVADKQHNVAETSLHTGVCGCLAVLHQLPAKAADGMI